MSEAIAERSDLPQVRDGDLPQVQEELPKAVEAVLVQGDLSQLTPENRVAYYRAVCRSLGLNHLTQPFEYIELDGKLRLYPLKTCTDQLRMLRGVNLEPVRREIDRELGAYIVEVKVTLPDGRYDFATGVVSIVTEQGEWKTAQSGKRYFAGTGEYVPIRGDRLANALMRAESKAKRRATLSICGLGWMDESELDTVKSARRVQVDHTTGEILDGTPDPPAPAEPPPATPYADAVIDRPSGPLPENPFAGALPPIVGIEHDRWLESARNFWARLGMLGGSYPQFPAGATWDAFRVWAKGLKQAVDLAEMAAAGAAEEDAPPAESEEGSDE